MKNINKPIKNQKGMALLLAVFAIVLIGYLVTEITYETNVEYLINAGAVNKVKAYYAAKSGLQISLLRIKLYNQVQSQFGKQLGSQSKLLDMIWSMPFTWPPILPEAANAVDKELVEDAAAESKMDGSYFTSIVDEGSKFDINDLASPSKGIRQIAMKQLLTIFESKTQQDETWARAHQNFRPQELVNNIQDWVDLDNESLNSGDERQYYAEMNRDGQYYPPNRGFRTVEELRLVKGMDEDLFNTMKDRITVFGMKAINPNHATKEVLRSLDPSMTEEVVSEVLKRRSDDNLGGQFRDKNDFWGYVNAKGGRVAPEVQEQTPLRFDSVFNFKITSTGEFAGQVRVIEAVVFDVKKAAAFIAEQVKKENNPQPNPNDPKNPQNNQNNQNKTNDPLPKGPPRIVYWTEK